MYSEPLINSRVQQTSDYVTYKCPSTIRRYEEELILVKLQAFSL